MYDRCWTVSRRIKRSKFKKPYRYGYHYDKHKTYKYDSHFKVKDTKLKVVSIVSIPIFLLGAAIATAKKIDEKFDHTTATCFITNFCEKWGLDLGWKHQLSKIQEAGYDAYYQKERTDNYYRKSITLTVQDGYYTQQEKIIPEGYEILEVPFHGNDCYREEHIPESIIIKEENGLSRQLTLKK